MISKLGHNLISILIVIYVPSSHLKCKFSYFNVYVLYVTVAIFALLTASRMLFCLDNQYLATIWYHYLRMLPVIWIIPIFLLYLTVPFLTPYRMFFAWFIQQRLYACMPCHTGHAYLVCYVCHPSHMIIYNFMRVSPLPRVFHNDLHKLNLWVLEDKRLSFHFELPVLIDKQHHWAINMMKNSMRWTDNNLVLNKIIYVGCN